MFKKYHNITFGILTAILKPVLNQTCFLGLFMCLFFNHKYHTQISASHKLGFSGKILSCRTILFGLMLSPDTIILKSKLQL